MKIQNNDNCFICGKGIYYYNVYEPGFCGTCCARRERNLRHLKPLEDSLGHYYNAIKFIDRHRQSDDPLAS